MDSVPHHAPSGTIPQKQCTGPCQRVLPATTEYFHRDKKSKDGLYPQCKMCKSARAKAYHAAHKEEDNARSRQYHAAHLEEERERSRQRYAAHREEERARCKQYYAAHCEEERAHHKQYYAAHREEDRARCKQWYTDHQEQARAYARQYSRDHQEQVSEQKRKYHEAHAEERRAYAKAYNQTERGILAKRADRHNRRAHKKNAPGSHTAQQLHEQYQRQRGRCYYCHKQLGKGRDAWHADHIVPLSRGGSNDISNIVITCPQCNCKKHDKLPHEWADGGRLLEAALPYRPMSGASEAV